MRSWIILDANVERRKWSRRPVNSCRRRRTSYLFSSSLREQICQPYIRSGAPKLGNKTVMPCTLVYCLAGDPNRMLTMVAQELDCPKIARLLRTVELLPQATMRWRRGTDHAREQGAMSTWRGRRSHHRIAGSEDGQIVHDTWKDVCGGCQATGWNLHLRPNGKGFQLHRNHPGSRHGSGSWWRWKFPPPARMSDGQAPGPLSENHQFFIPAILSSRALLTPRILRPIWPRSCATSPLESSGEWE